VETVVVTATKRSVNIENIPFSINAVSSARLEKERILGLSDLDKIAPEIQPSSNPTNTVIGMRGIFDGNVSTTESAGSDHSVGIMIDDVPAAGNGDAASLGQDFYDLDRIEILRGPQGTLFGRNVTGGLISLHSQAPSFDPSLSVKVGYGDYGAYQTQAYVTGGITDTLAGRLSLNVEGDGGYKKNIELGGSQGEDNGVSGRGQLLWRPTDNFKLLAGIEIVHNNGESIGAGTLLGNYQPNIAQPLLKPIVAGPWGPAGAYPTQVYGQDSVQSPVNGSLLTNNVAGFVRADWNVGGWGTVTSVTGYRTVDIENLVNGDETAFASDLSDEKESERQFTEELRIASPEDRSLRYVAGVFYLSSTRAVSINVPIDYSMFAPLSPTGTPEFGYLLESGAALEGLGVVTQFDGLQRQRVNLHSEALFGELNYDIFPKLTVTVGGRYTWDSRDGTQFSNYDYGGLIRGSTAAPGTQIGETPDAAGIAQCGCYPAMTQPLTPILATDALPVGVSAAYPLLVGGPGVSAGLHGSWSAFTPRVSLSFKPEDNLLLYATVSRGFTAGGFNLGGSNGAALATPFNPEYAWNYEGGFKGTFLDHRLLTNLTLFYQDYSDLQVDQFNNNCLCITTQNAATAHSEGFELEAVGKPVRWLTVGANWAYDEAKYDRYLAPNPAGGAPMNYAGHTLQNAPLSSLSLYADGTWTVADVGQFDLGANVSFSGRRWFSAANNDSALIHDQSARQGILDLHASWASLNDRWEVAVWGKNVTNQRYLVSALTGLSVLDSAYAPPLPAGSDVAFVNWNLPPTFGATLTFKYR